MNNKKIKDERGTKNVLLTCQDKSEINIKGELMLTCGDVIKEDQQGLPEIPFWYFSLILYKDKLEQDIIDKLLNPDFGICQIKMIYDNGTEEVLVYFDGEEKSKELTKVLCDGEFIDIKIKLDKKGSN